jgi:plastocyanin
MQKLLKDPRVLLPVVLTAVVIAVGSLLIVLLSADASGAAGGAGSVSRVGARGALRIDITDFKFKPETVTVKAGAKVTWVNNDTAPHTATDAAHGAFDTGTLRKGDQKTLTLKKAGTYAYLCEFHPFMKATVIVQ